MNNKKQELAEIIGPNNVFDDTQILDEYARDRSFAVPLKPSMVVRPENAQAVQQIVQWANRTQTPLVPVSSGPVQPERSLSISVA